MNAAVAADLAAWSAETHAPLPLPVHEIAWRERCDAVVDLTTGVAFTQHDNFVDFALRWRAERARRGRVADASGLAAALQRAFGAVYDYPDRLWVAIARTALRVPAGRNADAA